MSGNKLKNKKGFTLMEVLVVLSLFSILGILIVNVFLLSLQSQRQVAFRQKTLSNLRYSMETMARNIRTSEIDYDYYEGVISNSPENKLALIDQSGRKISYSLDTDQRAIELEIDLVERAFLTNTEDVDVISLDFYIDPITNPFFGERCDGPAGNNGCESNLECTVPIDDGTDNKVGFCICSNDSECATNNCDEDTGYCLPFDKQPRVTIVLGFQSKGVKPEDIKTIYLQSTVVSRVYKR